MYIFIFNICDMCKYFIYILNKFLLHLFEIITIQILNHILTL